MMSFDGMALVGFAGATRVGDPFKTALANVNFPILASPLVGPPSILRGVHLGRVLIECLMYDIIRSMSPFYMQLRINVTK